MRSKEEVEKMFDMIKTDLDKIEDVPRTGDSLEECKCTNRHTVLCVGCWKK